MLTSRGTASAIYVECLNDRRTELRQPGHQVGWHVMQTFRRVQRTHSLPQRGGLRVLGVIVLVREELPPVSNRWRLRRNLHGSARTWVAVTCFGSSRVASNSSGQPMSAVCNGLVEAWHTFSWLAVVSVQGVQGVQEPQVLDWLWG